ncbi:MAG: peroxide stress protein YaaA, partial [Bacteroidota bacterium]
MKIVISPAKSLDFETELPTSRFSAPLFLDASQKLNAVLVKKKPKALAKLMSISDNLAELNWQRNQQFSVPFTTANARPAVYAFNGDVYQGLDAYTLPEEKLDSLQDKLRILSGLYGILRPLDLIQPYRLEMGTPLKVARKKNLYEFWKKRLTQHVNEELKEDELFLNLASNEYFGAIDEKQLKTEVITPIFKDWKNDNLKVISFFAKKARGLMVRYVLDTNAKT